MTTQIQVPVAAAVYTFDLAITIFFGKARC
jgi:hypothetical protein